MQANVEQFFKKWRQDPQDFILSLFWRRRRQKSCLIKLGTNSPGCLQFLPCRAIMQHLAKQSPYLPGTIFHTFIQLLFLVVFYVSNRKWGGNYHHASRRENQVVQILQQEHQQGLLCAILKGYNWTEMAPFYAFFSTSYPQDYLKIGLETKKGEWDVHLWS